MGLFNNLPQNVSSGHLALAAVVDLRVDRRFSHDDGMLLNHKKNSAQKGRSNVLSE